MMTKMMTLEQLFTMGMDRSPGLLLEPRVGLSIDLGAGKKRFGSPGYNLQLPDWEWPRDPIPAGYGEAAIIHAYHFLEHLTGEDAIALFKEVERVLCVGGIFQFCIPYYNTQLASQDLTHKSYWTEDSFKILFKNKYYDPTAGKVEDWKLEVQYLLIAGVVERNLALVGQLVRKN